MQRQTTRKLTGIALVIVTLHSGPLSLARSRGQQLEDRFLLTRALDRAAECTGQFLDRQDRMTERYRQEFTALVEQGWPPDVPSEELGDLLSRFVAERDALKTELGADLRSSLAGSALEVLEPSVEYRFLGPSSRHGAKILDLLNMSGQSSGETLDDLLHGHVAPRAVEPDALRLEDYQLLPLIELHVPSGYHLEKQDGEYLLVPCTRTDSTSPDQATTGNDGIGPHGPCDMRIYYHPEQGMRVLCVEESPGCDGAYSCKLQSLSSDSNGVLLFCSCAS